jgi:ubiquinone/menaquinone biosynthesis C-methylase UbiE
MKQEYEAHYHRVEERHWWFRGRRDLVHALVLAANADRGCAILEVGCSGGPLIQELQEAGYDHVTGLDISEEAIALARQRGLSDTHVMDAQKLSFADERFDVVTASDVLEHLADAPLALREWRRVLKANGVLIVFVPAFRWLWSEHDEANRHQHRYRRRELEALLTANGFIVERSSYWNFSLFFPVALMRVLKRLLPWKKVAESGDIFAAPRPINTALTWLLHCENRWLRRGWNLPVGISVMVIARRSGERGGGG